VEGVAFVGLRRDDIVRSDLVMRIVDAYEEAGEGEKDLGRRAGRLRFDHETGKQIRKKALVKKVDELHRSPTWFESFRAWIQAQPKGRLYVALTALTWLALTALIGLGTRLPIERTVAQGIIESGTCSGSSP
jgi:hypothetical protein